MWSAVPQAAAPRAVEPEPATPPPPRPEPRPQPRPQPAPIFRSPTASLGPRPRRWPTSSLAKPWQIRIRQRLQKRKRHDEHCSSPDPYHGRHSPRGRGPVAAFRRGRARVWRGWLRRVHDRTRRRQRANQDHGGAGRLFLRDKPSAVDPGGAPATGINHTALRTRGARAAPSSRSARASFPASANDASRAAGSAVAIA